MSSTCSRTRLRRARELLFVTLAALFCVALVARRASAEDIDDATCMSCHDGDRRHIDAAAIGASAHRGVTCQSCHADIKASPHPSKLAKVDCGRCHTDQLAAFQKDLHAELAKKGVADLATCTSCHGTHDIYPKNDLRSATSQVRVNETCMKCHGDPAVASKHEKLPGVDFTKKYLGSVHGRALQLKGLTVSASCASCHGFHGIRPAADKASTVNKGNIPVTCGTCHLGIYMTWKDSIHGRMWKFGHKQGPVCTTCHNSHEIQDPSKDAFRLSNAASCAGCHKEQAESYRDTFHGKATSLGYVVAATCSDCHTAHANLSKDDPQSSIHKTQLPKTCGKCHPNASENFVRYIPHLNPKDPTRSPLIYYIRHFMELLLLGTFSFFGLHTLLWLQRSLVGALRKEFPKEEDDVVYVKRFSNTTVGLHITVVTSFLVLVSTGFPLHYHGNHWAKALAGLFGGIEVARYFHRMFAAVTIGYGLFHAGSLFWRIGVKKERHLLGGPDSMVPRLKDLFDMLHNIRWFFYMGKRPEFGTWTYYEKFDYFAVFWGIPVIGLSGLMLWFPGFFTRFLPGEALNIAAIVHSEEALLAAGFIFTMHFFHNHCRPENFPIDISVFIGKVPLERFKHERPEQYALLVETGKLEDVKVPPPSPGARRAALIFGYSALGTGVILILAVAWTLIFAH